MVVIVVLGLLTLACYIVYRSTPPEQPYTRGYLDATTTAMFLLWVLKILEAAFNG